MKTYTAMMVTYAALAIGASAQAQNQPSAQGSAAAGAQTSVSATDGEAKQADASLAGGTELNATLYKPVDVGKSKPGDEVTATIAQDVKSGGQIVIPKGTKLIGHVTKAQPRSKGGSSSGGSVAGSTDSQLGIVFERAVLKDGREIPLNATIQAVAAARSAASAGANSMDASTASASSAGAAGSSAGGGLVGGVAGTVGTVAGASGAVSSTVGGTVSKSAGATGGLNTAGRLTSGSKGVFGLDSLDITSAATSSAEGSVITSKLRNVRLDGGTQLLLVTGADAAGGAGSVSGAANAAGSVSGAAKKTGDSGAEKTQERPDTTDKR